MHIYYINAPNRCSSIFILLYSCCKNNDSLIETAKSASSNWTNNVDDTVNGIENENNEDVLLTEEEITKILGKHDSSFYIENIEKSGNNYVFTVRKDEIRYVTEKEYNNLLNGGSINFRGSQWEYNETKIENNANDITISSKNKDIAVLRYLEEENKYVIAPIAGAAYLYDYSTEEYKFKVKGNTIISSLADKENGETLDKGFNKLINEDNVQFKVESGSVDLIIPSFE